MFQIPELSIQSTILVLLITIILWYGKKLPIIKKLIKKYQRHSEKQKTFELCQRGRLDEFKHHMEKHKFSPNLKQGDGQPLLIVAVIHEDPKASKHDKQQVNKQHDPIEFLTYLLQKGADIDIQNKGQGTAFLTAIYWNDLKIARFLFNYHPQVDHQQTRVKQNPLSSALYKNYKEEVLFLTVVCRADENLALEILAPKIEYNIDEAKCLLYVIRFLYALHSVRLMNKLTEEQKILNLLNENEISEIVSFLRFT